MHELEPVPYLLTQMLAFVIQLQGMIDAAAILHWAHRPAPGSWSLTELLCHLRDVEQEVHQPRFRELLAKENAFIAGADPDRWAVERGYQQQDGARALADFVAARQETVAFLHPLPEAIWQRRGRHAFFGPTSMHELLHLAVKHDQAHWPQLQAVITQP
ncbi:MAG: DinB family protein [Anaerolineae bacterium]|nr:DinB family protein [Anaerolineae bacterium]